MTRSRLAALALALWAVLLAPAAAAKQQEATSNWASVRRAQGHTVTVARRGAEPMDAVVAVVDQSRVVLVTPGNVVSTAEWRDLLRRAESRWDGVTMGERVTGRGGREICPEGLFERGYKVANWTSVAREDVVAITGRWRKQGRTVGLIVGLAAGVGVAIPLAVVGGIANNETGRGGTALALAAIAPVAGASAGYFAFSHEETLFYRVETPAGTLDDETWRRIRATLPASLRGGATGSGQR